MVRKFMIKKLKKSSTFKDSRSLWQKYFTIYYLGIFFYFKKIYILFLWMGNRNFLYFIFYCYFQNQMMKNQINFFLFNIFTFYFIFILRQYVYIFHPFQKLSLNYLIAVAAPIICIQFPYFF